MIRMENISLRSAVRVIQAFAARETVLVVAVAAALASCALVPPDAGYAAYVDWHTLALLFCLMAVVAGFRSLGVLDAVGAWLVARARTQRAVAGVLVGLAFFASMAVTNDVALITFVPLALVVLRRAGMEGRMCLVATLMTIAANLGSMFTPVGNPQNLYLFTASGMGVGEFLQLMGPYTAASGAMLALACVLCFRGGEVRGAGGVGRFASSGGFAFDDTADDPAMQVPPARWTAPEGSAPDCMPARSANGASPASSSIESASLECFTARSRKRLAMYGILFACCLAAVLGVLDVRVLLALVLVGVSLSDASLLRRVDWGLLATFAALFVFVGNMGRVPVLHEALSAAVGGNALLAAVGGRHVQGGHGGSPRHPRALSACVHGVEHCVLGGFARACRGFGGCLKFRSLSIITTVAPCSTRCWNTFGSVRTSRGCLGGLGGRGACGCVLRALAVRAGARR